MTVDKENKKIFIGITFIWVVIGFWKTIQDYGYVDKQSFFIILTPPIIIFMIIKLIATLSKK